MLHAPPESSQAGSISSFRIVVSMFHVVECRNRSVKCIFHVVEQRNSSGIWSFVRA